MSAPMTALHDTAPTRTPLSASILIAAPRAWRPLLDTAASALGEEERRLLRAITQRLHGDHIGIGVQAAACLARLLGPSPPLDRPSECQPWSLLLRRLERIGIWRPDPAAPSAAALAGGLRRRAHAVVARLVGPLVQRACDEIGQCILFGGDGHAVPTDFAARYAAYKRTSCGYWSG